MPEFFQVALAFPTVIYSVMLVFAGLYWLFVIMGAVDLDALDGLDGAEGALEGADGAFDAADGALDAADGAFDAADGALDAADGAFDAADGAFDAAEGVGAVKGLDALKGAGEALDGVDALKGAGEALDGVDAVKGAGDVLEGADDAAEAVTGASKGGLLGLLGAIFSVISVKNVPVTISLSLIVLGNWMMTALAVNYFELHKVAQLGWKEGVIFAAALPISIVVTRISLMPLSSVFESDEKQRISNDALVGKTIKVRTGSVSATFGQGEASVNEDSWLVQIRCDSGNALKRGDDVLVINWDEERQAYVVEPMEMFFGDDDNDAKPIETMLDFDEALEAAEREQQEASSSANKDKN